MYLYFGISSLYHYHFIVYQVYLLVMDIMELHRYSDHIRINQFTSHIVYYTNQIQTQVSITQHLYSFNIQ